MKLEEYRALKNKFQENYFKNIKSNLDKFEQMRLEKVYKYNKRVKPICFTIAVFGLIFSIIFSIRHNEVQAGFSFVLVFYSLIAICIFKKVYEYSLEMAVKSELMNNLCSCFDNLKWDRYIQNEDFHEIGLVESYNRKHFDDYFQGKYNDVNFEIIEAEFERERNSGKRKSSYLVFKGVILKIDLIKKLNSHTIIKKDAILKIVPRNLRHTELEDVTFEKKFDVYTNDETEARYLITPTFIQKINTIENVFKAKELSCVFKENYVYIAFHTKRDMFQVCSFDKPINDIPMFSEMFNEIVSIYNVIDYLKLGNNNIVEKG